MAKSLLADLMIAAPCDVPWESMHGDDRVRTCGGCSKNVYNIAGMSTREAEELLRTQENPCLRLFRRTDGTLVTDNCPRALRKMRDRFRTLAAAAAGIVMAVLALEPVSAQQLIHETTGGKRPVVRDWSQLTPTSGMMMPITAHPQPGDAGPHVQIWNATGEPPVQTLPHSSDSVQPYEAGPDTSALELYKQAVRCERAGSTLLAKTLYSEALEAARKNQNSDPAFRQLLRDSVKRLEQELRGD